MSLFLFGFFSPLHYFSFFRYRIFFHFQSQVAMPYRVSQSAHFTSPLYMLKLKNCGFFTEFPIFDSPKKFMFFKTAINNFIYVLFCTYCMSKNRPNLRRYTEVQNWLKGKSKGTKCVYTSALKAFTEYTKMNPVQLIDEAEEDFKKSGREKGASQRKIIGFFEHLRTEYMPIRNGFDNSKFKGKKGVSVNLACTYSHAIQSFYSANNFPFRVKIQKAITKKENQKLALRIPEVKRLLDSTRNLRDKSIILTLFQTGMSIQNLCDLTYGDVAEGLEKNEEPLHLNLVREKTWLQYNTFMGKDAIDALKAYLDWRRRNGEELKLNSPLFTKQFTKSNSKSVNIKAINPVIIEENFQSLAIKSGLISKEKLEAADINPARPSFLEVEFHKHLKIGWHE